jgi:diguanylate cyclase (GGDEF)-like protein
MLWNADIRKDDPLHEAEVASMISLRRALGHRFALRTRFGFEFKLLTTLALTLIVVGGVQYALTVRDTRQRLLDEAMFRAQSDVVFVQQAFASGTSTDQRVSQMNDRLAAIGGRPGIRYVLLVDHFGVVNAASDSKQVGTYHGGPELRQVVDTGKGTTRLINDDGERSFRYIIPVDLPTGRFALELEQNASVIEGQLVTLRNATLWILGGGIGFGIVLFFVLGGRSVAKMHHRALQMSSKDGLTDLENHRSFQETLTHILAVAQRQNSTVSVALIDLDDFKLINDRLGHGQGDEVLKGVAALLETGRLGDRAFRIGGDEFALVLPATNSEGAWVVCERIWRSISKDVSGVTVSIGVATSTPMMDQPDLCEHADVALYEAKRRGRNNIVSFEEIGGQAIIPAEKVRSVRKLLDDLELGTAFQPIWDLEGDRPLGFEALARPPADYALTGPAELYEIGEMIGRTQDLDVMSWRWALTRAKGLPSDICLFLNVSPFTADHGDGPIDRLCEVVAHSAFEPQQIVVEFTEKWSGRRDLVVEQAERLRDAGFKLALDDVGAGAGDLEMMAKLPVDFIKIDMHIIKNAPTDPIMRGVLSAICAFAAHSGSQVIAEGIEDEKVLRFLREEFPMSSNRGTIRAAQGYFLGRPSEGAPIIKPAPYPPLHSRASLTNTKV